MKLEVSNLKPSAHPGGLCPPRRTRRPGGELPATHTQVKAALMFPDKSAIFPPISPLSCRAVVDGRVALKGIVHSYKRLAGEVSSLVFFAAETATILMRLFFGSVSVVAPFGRSSRYLNRLQKM